MVLRMAARAWAIAVPAMLAASCASTEPTSGSDLPATDDVRPELVTGCENLTVPPGNVVSFHGYAQGVEIYVWDDAAHKWLFVAPEATLYSDADFVGRVAAQFTGPTWQSNSGSSVVGRRIATCTPDETAIPWQLLAAVTSHGPGLLADTTYIQRTATTGGLAPADPGKPEQRVKVPFTAEYYFYRRH
jgi:hypothetical protein